MSEKFIREVNEVLYSFIKKILYDNQNNIQTDAHDILQEAWTKTWEAYPDKRQDERQFRPLLFVVAKREAIKHKKKKSRLIISDKHLNEKKQSYSSFYEQFLRQDLATIQRFVPSNYLFILQKAEALETEYSQEIVVNNIKKEYMSLFGSKLTLANYRQIKRRATQKLIALLQNENL